MYKFHVIYLNDTYFFQKTREIKTGTNPFFLFSWIQNLNKLRNIVTSLKTQICKVRAEHKTIFFVGVIILKIFLSYFSHFLVVDFFQEMRGFFNPFIHPNISMHILLTIRYKFSKIRIRRICLKNLELFQLVIMIFILVTLKCDSGMVARGEIRCWSLLKG